MSAAKQPDSSLTEFEIDLTGEAEQLSDQRHADRQETSASLIGTVEFRTEVIPVRIDDLSIGGVGISMDTRIPEHQECKLTIHLSVCGSDYELSMKCRVRHCDAVNNKTYEAGLQFIDMTQGTRDTLLLLIR
jgi:c-di-GMP-binding flagellar brake protein YcgR